MRGFDKVSRDLILRRYEYEDIPRAIDLMMEAFPTLPNYKLITPDRERIKYVLTSGIDNAASFAGWVLCDTHNMVQGFSGGWCVRSLMSYDFVADDIFCWVEPEYRSLKNVNLLIKAYVQWAEGKGAKLIRASHTGGSFVRGSREWEMFNAILNRLGFTEVGSVYHLNKYGDE
jgi:hypothetical protein